jgi:hypothetical protein
MRRLAAAVGLPNVAPLLSLAEAKRGAPLAALRAQFQSALAGDPPLSPSQLALNGQEVMQVLGIPPGPAVGEAVRYLFERVLEDPTQNERVRLEGLLRAWRSQ